MFFCPALLAHHLGNDLSGAHRHLGGVDGGGQAGAGGGVQPEGPGDPGDFPRGQHQPQPQQGVVVEHHQPRHQDGGLQKSGEAQRDYLLAPLGEAVTVAPGDAEHIQRPHRNLDEQDTAPLQVGEKHLDHGVGHQDHAEQHHDGVEGRPIKNEIHPGGDEPIRGGELGDQVLPQRPDVAQPGDAGGEAGLQRYGQGVEPDGDGGEQAHRHKPLQAVDGGVANIPPA